MRRAARHAPCAAGARHERRDRGFSRFRLLPNVRKQTKPRSRLENSVRVFKKTPVELRSSSEQNLRRHWIRQLKLQVAEVQVVRALTSTPLVRGGSDSSFEATLQFAIWRDELEVTEIHIIPD